MQNEQSRYVPLGVGPGSLLAERFLVQSIKGADSFSARFLVHDRLRDEKNRVLRLFAPEVPGALEYCTFAGRLSKYEYPAAVRVFEAGQLNPRQCYALIEDCEYASLQDLLDKLNGHLLPVSMVKYLMFNLAHALAHAHLAGIVHGDLKPSQILISPQGEIRLRGYCEFTFKPQSNFRSPEQRRGERIDRPTDVYALGALLCLLLSGALPEYLEAKGVKFKEISAELAELLAQMLELDPKARLSPISKLADELEDELPRVPEFIDNYYRLTDPHYRGGVISGIEQRAGMWDRLREFFQR